MGNKTEWHPGIVKESSKVVEGPPAFSELGLGPDESCTQPASGSGLSSGGFDLHHVEIFQIQGSV